MSWIPIRSSALQLPVVLDQYAKEQCLFQHLALQSQLAPYDSYLEKAAKFIEKVCHETLICNCTHSSSSTANWKVWEELYLNRCYEKTSAIPQKLPTERGFSHYLTLVSWQGSALDCSSLTDAGLFISAGKFWAAPFLKWFDRDIFGSNQLIVVPEAKESLRWNLLILHEGSGCPQNSFLKEKVKAARSSCSQSLQQPPNKGGATRHHLRRSLAQTLRLASCNMCNLDWSNPLVSGKV